MKSYLIICQTAPYANATVAETIELTLALAAFEQKVNILFTAAGVLHLLPGQDAAVIQQKTFTKAYAGLHLFGIDAVYVDAQAMQQFNVCETSTVENPQLLSADQINNLITKFNYVICI